MKKFRIQLVWAAIVLICGVSLMGMVYLIFNKPEVYINPGVVVTQPSPVAEPVTPVTTRSRVVSQVPFSHTQYSYLNQMQEHSSKMNTGHGMYLHSHAEVHSVGGGMANRGVGASSTSNSGSSRGINYTQGGPAVVMPMTSFVAVASTRQVAQPAAQEAPQMAQMASPRRAPNPPNITDLEEGQAGHQLVETPIGGALLPLLLLAIGYIVYRKKRLAV